MFTICIPHIFERCDRGKNATVEGSDPGPAMVKSIIKTPEGWLAVENELGVGSQFTSELPPGS